MIYYVEDNEGIRNLVTYTLNMTGFEAQGFPEGESFFQAMETARPELILLDVMLPGEDGVTILGRLRRDPRFSAIPVIMITAKGEEADKVEGHNTFELTVHRTSDSRFERSVMLETPAGDKLIQWKADKLLVPADELPVAGDRLLLHFDAEKLYLVSE